MRIGNECFGILRDPLLGAGGTLGKFPLEGEQVFKEVVAPFRRRFCPRDFQTAGDGVATSACAEAVPPPEALFFETHSFRLRRNVRGRSGAMRFAERMT